MREQLLRGKLDLPSRNNFISNIGEHYTHLAERMLTSMWQHYLLNKGTTSLVYWATEFHNPKVFNIVLMSLAKSGWITTHSIPARNWAEGGINEDKLLNYVSSDELEQIRAYNKFQKYLSVETSSTKCTATKLNGKLQDTGLVREGFMLAGNTKFKYDTQLMSDYSTILEKNITKSMDKIKHKYSEFRSDKATYDTISVAILDYHITEDLTMTRGNNINDSRGRAISSALSKVFNPISSKDARALLEIVYEE